MKSSVHVTTHVRFCISKYICILQYICNFKCIFVAKTQKQTMLHCHNVIIDNFWKYSLKEHLNFCHQTFLNFWIETKFPGPLCCYLSSKSLHLFWTVLSPKFHECQFCKILAKPAWPSVTTSVSVLLLGINCHLQDSTHIPIPPHPLGSVTFPKDKCYVVSAEWKDRRDIAHHNL